MPRVHVARVKEIVRHGTARAFALALRCRSVALQPIAGPVLVIAPHPDDETLGCGGLIARQAAAGRVVRTVFLTSGESSHRGHPTLTADEVAARRRGEALAALACLGVAEPAANATFLALPDGGLDHLAEERTEQTVAILAAEIRALRPAAVLAPYRQGGSSEHTAAWELAYAALRDGGGGLLFEYPIWAWWNSFRLARRLWPRVDNLRLALGALRDVKVRALACHRTQVEPTTPWTAPLLPPVLTTACCDTHEFYFRRRVPPRN